MSHTDVALVKLVDAERFSNVTFKNDDMPEPVQFKRLISAKHLKGWEIVALDSPDTGCIERTFLGQSL